MAQTQLKEPAVHSEPHSVTLRQTWLPSLLEFTLVLALALLGLEPVLTVAGAADEQYLDIDPITGWSPMPNRTFTYRREGYSHCTINSMGMRDMERSFSKPKGTFRIAVLGCSLTEALQVSSNETYCSVLERQLNAHSGTHKYEVLNFGVGGFNLGQLYLRLNHLAMRFDPDLVVFAAKPLTVELLRTTWSPLGLGNPQFTAGSDGQLIVDDGMRQKLSSSNRARRLRATRWLRVHSRLWGIVCHCAESLTVFIGQLSAVLTELSAQIGSTNARQTAHSSAPITTASNENNLAEAGKLTQAILANTNQECISGHRRFVLVYLPELTDQAHRVDSITLKSCADRLSLNYIDLNPVFKKLNERPHEPFIMTRHYSAAGHRVISEQIEAFLEKKGLLE